MCIAIAKPSNVALPNLDLLKNCFLANPEGAGYAFCSHGSVIIRKGFMTWKDFVKEYEDFNLEQMKQCAMLFHFRIGTHGLKYNPKHTHPFALTDDYTTMEQLYVKTKAAVIHNGMLTDYGTSTYGKKDPELREVSDTMEFIKEVLSPLEQLSDWYKNKIIEKLFVSALGSYNKVAILRSDNTIQMEGAFVEDKGVFYSNRGFESRVYGSYGGCYDSEYDKDDYWTRKTYSTDGKVKTTYNSTLWYEDDDGVMRHHDKPLSIVDYTKKEKELEETFKEINKGEKFDLQASIRQYIKGFEGETWEAYGALWNDASETIEKFQKNHYELITVPSRFTVRVKDSREVSTLQNYPIRDMLNPIRKCPLCFQNMTTGALMVLYYNGTKAFYTEYETVRSLSYSADFEMDWNTLGLSKIVFAMIRKEMIKGRNEEKTKVAAEIPVDKDIPKVVQMEVGEAGSSEIVVVPEVKEEKDV
jgi:hypothetical protein